MKGDSDFDRQTGSAIAALEQSSSHRYDSDQLLTANILAYRDYHVVREGQMFACRVIRPEGESIDKIRS